LVRHPVRLSVAGRTDAGVHASGQVASAPVDTGLPADRIRRGLAGILPHDLAARRVGDAPAGFDARADALARRYEYRLLVGPDSPLRRGRVHEVRRRLDVGAMRDAAARTEGRHDFSAFTPTRTEHVFFHRTVTECRLDERGDELVLVIEADAFLRSMVRTVAGTLVDVGLGRRSPGEVSALLDGGPRSAAGPTLPAHGLTLVGVRYGVFPGAPVG
jgi:tRNA pseudouridine38-40 synthase